jgi:HAD superfamily hydrolase (TIGR01509 family)
MGRFTASSAIAAVLFDLDGVLVDACDWHYHALNRALNEISGIEISRVSHEKNFNGLPTKTKLSMLKDLGGVAEKDMPAIWKLKQKYTTDVINEMAKPDPTKIAIHKWLSSKMMGIYCVTNSIRETTRLMLDKTGQLKYIRTNIISNEDVTNPKPHAEGYIKAMLDNASRMRFNLIALKPSQFLIVEDSDKGYQAAKQTGAHVWRVANAQEVTLENLRMKLDEISIV